MALFELILLLGYLTLVSFCRLMFKMPGLIKSCPNCCANVHVRKALCDCGHCFSVTKPKPSFDTARKSKRIAMRSRRALATANLTKQRREQSRVAMGKKRASECPVEGASRKEHN